MEQVCTSPVSGKTSLLSAFLDSRIVSWISVRVRGHGTCKRTLVDLADKRCIVSLTGVLYVPDLALGSNGNYLRLLSALVATNKGCRLEFTQPGDILWTPEGSVFEMVKSIGLVWLPTVKQFVVTIPTTVLSKQTNYDTIYRRCCHVSDETIRKMSTLGIKCLLVHCTRGSRAFYKACVVAKSTIANINRESTRADDPDTCFHTLAVERKKEIPYKEVILKDIGAHVEYIVLY